MKLQDYIHYYIGCKMIRSSHYEPQNEPYILHFEIIREAVEFGDRPLLRRLADMTQNEIIGLLQSMWPPKLEDKPLDDEYILEVFKGDGGNLVNSDVAIGANYNIRCFSGTISIKDCGTICLYDEAGDEQEGVNIPAAYHYLLQQQFDIFNLIGNGLAIDSKTIK